MFLGKQDSRSGLVSITTYFLSEALQLYATDLSGSMPLLLNNHIFVTLLLCPISAQFGRSVWRDSSTSPCCRWSRGSIGKKLKLCSLTSHINRLVLIKHGWDFLTSLQQIPLNGPPIFCPLFLSFLILRMIFVPKSTFYSKSLYIYHKSQLIQ